MVVREMMEAEARYAPAAIVVDDLHLNSVRPELRGLEVFPVSALDQVRSRGLAHAVVAIGDNDARRRCADLLRRRHFQLIQVRHPGAIVARSAVLGDGTVVMPGAVVGSGARLGCDVIVNTGASVDHDCVLEDGVHICPGAHLAGSVRVGERTQVGIGASVVPGVRIGARCTVGAGAAVVRDLPDGVVAFGVPARVVRGVESGAA